MRKPLKAKPKISTLPIDDGGLAALYHHVQHEKKAAKQIFAMVTNERGTDAEIKAITTQRTIQELIFLIIELTTCSRAAANQARSKEVAGLAKIQAKMLLYDWLDANLVRFPGKLEDCTAEAIISIKNLGRGDSWVRKQITLYKKDRRPI